jgi:hypothetical protein
VDSAEESSLSALSIISLKRYKLFITVDDKSCKAGTLLCGVIDKLIGATCKAPKATGYKGEELQTLANNLTLKHLLALAADAKSSEM